MLTTRERKGWQKKPFLLGMIYCPALRWSGIAATLEHTNNQYVRNAKESFLLYRAEEFLTFTKINYGWFSGHYFMGLSGLEKIYDAMNSFAHILKSWNLNKIYLFFWLDLSIHY